MGDERPSLLKPLIHRMREGDLAARREFLGYVDERVHVLARNILDVHWPRLRGVTDSRSLANRAALRLLTQKELTTPSLDDFMRYCAWLVDKILRDVARRKKRRPGDYGRGAGEDDTGPFFEVQSDGSPPSQHAQGVELLGMIETLPEHLREIVHLHGYLSLPQSEVAKMLNVSPKDVSRRWNKAKQMLNRRAAE